MVRMDETTEVEDGSQSDVLVVGAGPAGCTVATLLAKQGRQVRLVEKERFPRYHIGESLMPFCWFTLDKLGLVDAMEKHSFVHKHSVQFVTPDGTQSRPFYFFQHYDHPSATTWQVERREFDQMLMENARASGVEVVEGFKVRRFLRDGDGGVGSGAVVGVVGEGDDGECVYRAKVTVDATGRDALSMAKHGWRERDPVLNKIAMWTSFRGAKRDDGLDAGSTTVAYLPEKGWFWYIPLKNDLVSVGVVAERDYLYRDPEVRAPEAIIAREAGENEWIKEHLAPGESTGDYWTTGEYSYRSRYCADDGLVLVGDAFVFLDPVFSSGVFLALKSGDMAAEAIGEALDAGDLRASRFDGYGEALCGHVETMRKIVYSFYDANFSFGKVIRANPDVRGKLTDCLIGDVSKDFSDLFEAIREIVDLPGELDYGRAGRRQGEGAGELAGA